MANDVENELLKKAKNNLVKYDNDFVLSSNFNQLSSVQQDIFFSAVSFLCRDKTAHVVIPSSVIKARANLTDKKYTKSAYYNLLHGLEDVILKTFFTVHSEGKEWRGSLFDTFAIDDKTGDFEMFLNPHAANFFFQIPGPFSQFELQTLLGLKSKYAKNMFRMLLAHYNGRWNPSTEELISTFGLKNRGALSAFSHRIPKYVDDIKKTGYFSEIKHIVVRDDTKPGRPMTLIEFEFRMNPNKRNELSDLSRWWGNQKLSNTEKSYILPSQSTKTESSIIENKTAGTDITEKTKISEPMDVMMEPGLKCPICGSKFKKSHNPKSGTDFWGHADYSHSDCCYAKKTFDTIDNLQEFVEFERKKEEQKEKYRKIMENNPIAIAAQRAANEQKANREETRKALSERDSDLVSISESDFIIPEIFNRHSK